MLLVTAVTVVGCNKKDDNTKARLAIEEVDFDTSMGKGSPDFSLIFTNPEDAGRYAAIKGLYEKNSLTNTPRATTTKIPKIIHQIWVGPKVPPAHFIIFQEKWKKLHPDWEYRLWTDSEVEDLNLGLKDLIDQSPNYAEKSDIIRAELLDRFGGVYLDVDMDPFHTIDELNEKYDFWAGVEHPHQIATTNSRVWLGISIIASCPGHPIIKRWKELIRSRWDDVNCMYSSQIERIVNHTYFPFSMAFFEKYQEGGFTNIALPTTYFYPLAPSFASKRMSGVRAIREKLYDFLEDIHLKQARPFSRVSPESVAVHYWGNSWLPSQSQQLRDLQAQLDYLRKECFRMQTKIRSLEVSRGLDVSQSKVKTSTQDFFADDLSDSHPQAGSAQSQKVAVDEVAA